MSVILAILIGRSGHALALWFDQPDIDDGFGFRTIWSMARDQDGFIWLATTQNILRYDGYQFEPLDIPESIHYKKRTVHVDQSNRLWIGTELGELYRYEQGQITFQGIVSTVDQQVADKNWQINQITSIDDTIYIASQQGLFSQSPTSNQFKRMAGIDQAVKSLLVRDAGSLYFTLNNSLSWLDTKANTHQVLIQLDHGEQPRLIHQINQHALYLGTNQRLHHVNLESQQTTPVAGLPEAVIISLVADEQWLWVGTLTKGLYLLDLTSGAVTNFRHQPNTKGALSDDVIVSMLLTPDGALFLGTFDGNVNTTHSQRLLFGSISGSQIQHSCMRSNVIYHIYEDTDSSLWLSTANGVVHLSPDQCVHFAAQQGPNSLSYPEIRSISQGHQSDELWIATNQGLNRLHKKSQSIDRLSGTFPSVPTVFTVPKGDNQLLVGTESGLYAYWTKQGRHELMTAEGESFTNAAYFAHSRNQGTSTDYFATSQGLVQLVNDQPIPQVQINRVLQNAEVADIHSSQTDHSLYVTTTEHGLFQFDGQTQRLIRHWQPGKELPNPSQLLDILEDRTGDLWVSSRNGLYRFISDQDEVQIFFKEHGLQGNTFKRGASFAGKEKLYFGGLNGLNAFDPQHMALTKADAQVQLTHFRLFNQNVEPNHFKASINHLDQLVLGHRDYIFGFEFSAMNFSAPDRVKYAYQMEGLEPGWNTTDADNRQVSYSNLRPGHYTFKVKAATTQGRWSDSIKTLDVIIRPAPWLSWWAYLLYGTALLTLLVVVVRQKVRQQQKMSAQLKQQVTQQTQLITQQNDALQMLVTKKNEFFSNLTHEFRTPLTLILGPVQRLLGMPSMATQHSALELIQRNAEQLLKLVDQLLMLARNNEQRKVHKTTVNAAAVTKALMSTFEHQAREKGIDLHLSRVDTGWVTVTDSALEIILGNLLSNAIKYTQDFGKVEVAITRTGERLAFTVKDNGPGISKEHQESVFERFTRIGEYQTIEGVGIGLALAQEVAVANGAQLTLTSQPGAGCCFVFELPVTARGVNGQNGQNEPATAAPPVAAPTTDQTTTTDVSPEKPTLLLIEDNKDMQAHLCTELSAAYDCVLADDGQDGMSQACQLVPDIIICDVMMPKMDGFEVCRTLRSNPLTCHIPLVLLTALNEKTYRIKGWREGVDLFLTKPFDADELRMQLSNILNIRKAINLRHQNRFLRQSKPQDLPLVDAKFVDQFKACVEKHYQDAGLNVAKMASVLCVSERQLQRKCKALMEWSPTELLREWRISEAVKMLLDGYQVAQVADQCGFSSISYFSHTFKMKFGVSPKQYQQKYKNKREP